MIGNGDGLGRVREEELYRAYERLGVPAENVTILDDPYVPPACSVINADSRRLQDGMDNHWASSHVSHVLDHHLRSYPASIVGHLSLA
jgi:LmbE family N-acetylglucosaminyl deacetylase